MTGQALTVDVYSDVVCPWCYIGKRRLEQALESVQAPAHVFWRPFQLNPTMPKAGMDRRVYLETKFGGPGEMKAMFDASVAPRLSARSRSALARTTLRIAGRPESYVDDLVRELRSEIETELARQRIVEPQQPRRRHRRQRAQQRLFVRSRNQYLVSDWQPEHRSW